MGEALDRGDERQRQLPGDQHVERAVLVVVMEDAIGREKRGKKERHPQNTRSDASQQIEIGPKSERRDGDHHEIEAERGSDRAAFAQGKLHVAGKKSEGRAHATRSFPRVRRLANFVASFVWLATTATPPASR